MAAQVRESKVTPLDQQPPRAPGVSTRALLVFGGIFVALFAIAMVLVFTRPTASTPLLPQDAASECRESTVNQLIVSACSYGPEVVKVIAATFDGQVVAEQNLRAGNSVMPLRLSKPGVRINGTIEAKFGIPSAVIGGSEAPTEDNGVAIFGTWTVKPAFDQPATSTQDGTQIMYVPVDSASQP